MFLLVYIRINVPHFMTVHVTPDILLIIALHDKNSLYYCSKIEFMSCASLQVIEALLTMWN